MIPIAKPLIDAAGSRIGVAVVGAGYWGLALGRAGKPWVGGAAIPLSGES